MPLNNGLEYWTALQRQRVESKLIVFPDENHWIMSGEDSRYFTRRCSDWLAQYLGSAVRWRHSASAVPK